MDDGNIRLTRNVRNNGLAKEAGADEQVVEHAGLLFAGVGVDGDGPRAVASEIRLHNVVAELHVGALVAVQVALEVAADLPGAGELGLIRVPGEVAELDGVAALVGDHERVDEAGGVIAAGGPETADARLGVVDCDGEGAGGGVVEERLCGDEAGGAGA